MNCVSYYGIEKNLFNKEVSCKLAYKSSDYNKMISRLKYIKEIKGIGIFKGEAGFGKTFKLRNFKEKLNEDLYKIIYISVTKLTVFEFLNYISKELGIDVGNCYRNEVESNIQEEIKRIKKVEGKDTIIIIDNAENLKEDVLGEIKILYDFEMDSMDYVTTILCGTEEIEEEIRKKKYESLRQRVVVKYRLEGLTREETKEYIRSRIKLGGGIEEIFTEGALNAIYGITKGNIRKINTIVQTCFIIGSQKEEKNIDEEIVRMAKEEIM